MSLQEQVTGKAEQLKGMAEELRGKVEQAVGKATGSEETQARGKIDEVKGIAREKVADVKGDVKKLSGEAKVKTAEIKRKVKAALTGVTGLSFTSIALAVVGAVIVLALFRALSRRAGEGASDVFAGTGEGQGADSGCQHHGASPCLIT